MSDNSYKYNAYSRTQETKLKEERNIYSLINIATSEAVTVIFDVIKMENISASAIVESASKCYRNATVVGLSKYASDAELAEVELFKGYSMSLLMCGLVFCVIFMLIGIPGNFLTIIALARCEKVRNATAIFIINLHCSDLIFCCTILPLTAATFANQHWIYGRMMCRIYPYFKYVLNATSLFTVVAITINRCIMVCLPHWYPKIYKTRNILLMILTIWISAILIFSPSLFEKWGLFDIEPSGGLCTMMPDKNCKSPKKFLLIIAFIGPYLILITCYARIWWVVRKNAKKINRHSRHTSTVNLTSVNGPIEHRDLGKKISFQNEVSIAEDDSSCNNAPSTMIRSESGSLEKYFKAPFRLTRKVKKTNAPSKRDKRLSTLIVVIMMSFLLCHFPLLLVRTLYGEYKTVPAGNIFAHLLEYTASCMNPIVYVLMSKEYRQAYKSLFQKISCR